MSLPKLDKAQVASAVRAMKPYLQTSMATRAGRLMLAGIIVCMMALGGYSVQPQAITLPTQFVLANDPNKLSDMDKALYTAMFDAENRNEYSTVDNLLAQVSNQILMGHVLANRYLSEGYKSDASELVTWLKNYGDHPQASRIAALAAKKGADKSEVAGLVLTPAKPLKGDGYTFHLGRTTMPDNWYRGLRLWKERQFGPAAKSFAAVGTNEKLNGWQRSAGNYWAYRSLLKLGNTREANRALVLAAQEPMTFYGQLALARQGVTTPIRPVPPAVDYSLRSDPHVLRAQAFASLGMNDEAEQELRNLYANISNGDRPGLIALAAEMNLTNLQLRLASMKGLSQEEAAFASYPLPTDMIKAAEPIIDPSLVLAVARHESSFRNEVRSGAGATGVMQIMPATAKHVLRQAQRDSLTLADSDNSLQPIAQRLTNTSLSAQLGGTYLRMLIKDPAINGNVMKMLAGYNAGPGAVASWEKAARQMNDPLLYLESIPYAETHNYVTQVMANYWIYQSMRGQRAGSLDALAHGQWPTII